jgi:hypothetical protein
MEAVVHMSFHGFITHTLLISSSLFWCMITSLFADFYVVSY